MTPSPSFSFVLLRLYFLLPALSGLFVLTPYLCYPSGLPISPVLVLSRQRDSLFAVKTARGPLYPCRDFYWRLLRRRLSAVYTV